jgi:hypothetical protein
MLLLVVRIGIQHLRRPLGCRINFIIRRPLSAGRILMSVHSATLNGRINAIFYSYKFIKVSLLNHSKSSILEITRNLSPASHKELDQLLIVVVVQKLLEGAHLPCHIVTALYLGSVSVQVGNDPPQVCELSRLHLELRPDLIGILEYVFVFFGHKVHVIFLELQLF